MKNKDREDAMKNEGCIKILEAIGGVLVGLFLFAWAFGALMAGFILFPEAIYLSDRLVLEGNGYAAYFPLWVLITAIMVAVFSTYLGVKAFSSAIPSRIGRRKRVANPIKAQVIGIGSTRYFNEHWKGLMLPIVPALVIALFVQGLAPSGWSSGVYLVVLFPLLALIGWGFYRTLAKTSEAGEALWKLKGKGAISEE